MRNQKVGTGLGTIVLVIIAITVGAFVWVVIKNREVAEAPQEVAVQPKPVEKTQDEQNQQQVNTATQQIAELTKDWQTYRDEKNGYEFKYPQDYFVVDKKGSSSIETIAITSKKEYPGDGGCPKAPCNFPTHPQEITVTIFSEPDNFSLTEIQKRLEGNYVTKDSEKYMIMNGKSALYYNSYLYSDAIYIIGNKKTYFISSDLEWSKDSFKDIFRGIYSTFKEISKETVLTKSKEDAAHVYYDGSITISGNYQELSPNSILGGTLCFYANSESGYLIPRDPNLYGQNNGDNRNPWFCFSDQDNAKSMLGIDDKSIFTNKSASTSCIKGKATIEVSGYIVDKGESEVYDTAKLEKIITKEKYSFLEKCN